MFANDAAGAGLSVGAVVRIVGKTMTDGAQTEFPEGYTFPVIGRVKSCYKARFGIPRQPGLIPEARGEVRLLPPYNQPNTVRGLEGFSHIWLIFVFHEAQREGWKATVRPPRLGGDTRIGVFASRSPFRPAPVGLSVVRLERIEIGGHGKLCLHVSGLDLVDGTPVLDIKPYLPYTDSIDTALGGFAPQAPEAEALPVRLSATAEAQLALLERAGLHHFRGLACRVIGADPRPAYQREAGRGYGVFLEDFEVIWEITADGSGAEITEILPARRPAAP